MQHSFNAPMAALVDMRSQDGRTFDAALPPAAARFPLLGDMSRVWYGGRLAGWASAPGPRRLIGFCSDADYFVARRLCASLGMRAQLIVEHDSRRSDLISHRLAVHSPALERELSGAGAEWPTLLARRLVVEHSLRPAEERALVHASAGPSSDFPGYLLTWMISRA
jgi:hypothetical protein